MKLFNRQKDDTPTISEVPVPDNTDAMNEGSRIDWHRAGPRVAALVLCILLVVLGILWIAGAFDGSKSKSNDKPSTSSSKSAKQESGSKQSNNDSSSNASDNEAGSSSSNSNQGQTAPAAPSSSSTPASTPAVNSSLTNTGPGDTAAIVAIVATTTGLIGYQISLRRRATR